MKRKRGQSILEYVIVFAAIVAAVIVVATKIQSAVEKGGEDAATTMETSSGRIANLGGTGGD